MKVKKQLKLRTNGTDNKLWPFRGSGNVDGLIGTFYRPSNSAIDIWDSIEHSIELAFDTGIQKIYIMGDFNECQLSDRNTKIKSIVSNFAIHQLIKEPTSITKHSAILIDLIMTNDMRNVAYSSVLVPFLDVNIRYHCPVMCLIRTNKGSNPSFNRKIWLYDKGDTDKYRQILAGVNWDEIYDSNSDIDIFTREITNNLLLAASKSIPNKFITVGNNDLPWINNTIRKLMRKLNRARKKAKKSNNINHWNKFKTTTQWSCLLIKISQAKLCKQN